MTKKMQEWKRSWTWPWTLKPRPRPEAVFAGLARLDRRKHLGTNEDRSRNRKWEGPKRKGDA